MIETQNHNKQWIELMEKCQKNSKEEEIVREVLQLALEKDAVKEFPVDFICKFGTLEMFKTFIQLSEFDLDDNQPIVAYKLLPYASHCQNGPIVVYLITKVTMEFRIKIFERCIEFRNRLLIHYLLPFLPSEYWNELEIINDPLFFYKVGGNRHMHEILLRNELIVKNIIKFLDIPALFACREVCVAFRNYIDQDWHVWIDHYEFQKSRLYNSLYLEFGYNPDKTAGNMPKNLAKWKTFLDQIEDLGDKDKTRTLIQAYFLLNTKPNKYTKKTVVNPRAVQGPAGLVHMLQMAHEEQHQEMLQNLHNPHYLQPPHPPQNARRPRVPVIEEVEYDFSEPPVKKFIHRKNVKMLKLALENLDPSEYDSHHHLTYNAACNFVIEGIKSENLAIVQALWTHLKGEIQMHQIANLIDSAATHGSIEVFEFFNSMSDSPRILHHFRYLDKIHQNIKTFLQEREAEKRANKMN